MGLIGETIIMAAVAVSTVTPSSSKDLATAGRRSFDAMVCASYAGASGQAEEQQRLAQLGIDEGRRFLEAVEAGHITNEDRDRIIPVLFSLIMQGPSIDFVLGRFWEASAEYASDRIWEYDGANRDRAHAPSEEVRHINAERFFRESSCKSLR